MTVDDVQSEYAQYGTVHNCQQ